MDALIDLCLRAVLLALAHPFTRGLLLVLVALYGAGSGWPAWAPGLCTTVGLSSWALPLWRLWQERRRSPRLR
ncbi:hypothetical protein [Deinococcus hopiensis]|uniref:Uncharacterized protein n=1 Tax=Deinococcus hopiensis KR-140 TaxID=695939 RepID=A0A1W1VWZ3_9DEIO|nr:hypothetical protein [Deinococcus hopiensis]SMB97631.1 hypothetical protein SAMN00790413_06095 [Deinococcus hopiensis KR-140]